MGRLLHISRGVMVALFCAACAGAHAQVIYHASEPVQPDDTVILTGHALGDTQYVEVARLPDQDPQHPTADAGGDPPISPWVRVEPLLVSDESVHFTVPASLAQGVFAYRLAQGRERTPLRLLNTPQAWWVQGDRGNAAASPGGWLRVFGRGLHLGGEPHIALVHAQEGTVSLPVQAVRDEPNQWALTAWLPADLREGDYRVFVHHGFGGPSGWGAAGELSVAPEEQWKQDVFNVADFREEAQDDTEAIQAALEAAGENGGGVVYLPRGAYRVRDTLTVPRFVVLRGERQQWVSMTWEDREEPLAALIRGTSNFAVEDLTLYARNHLHGIVSNRGHSEGAGNVRIARVRMRLDRLVLGRRFEDPLTEAERRGRIEGRAAAIQVGGDNVQVTDCDIWVSPIFKHGSVLGFILDRARGALIARNRVGGPARISLITRGGDGIILEDNELMGGGFLGTHHTPGHELGGGGAFINTAFENVYYARNVVHSNNWWDRELMALDSQGPAGAYEGRILSAEGTRVTLADDPRYVGENWRRWIGSALYVLDGRGAGQYRRIVGGDEREVDVNRPWDVPPDGTSRVSVAKYHGRLLLVRNEFRDGGNVMFWAGALDSVIAENRVERIGSLISITAYIYNGLMPVWNVDFTANEVLEGNGSFGGSTGIGHVTYDSDRFFDVFDGFLSRGVVIRRNVVHNNGKLYVSGAVRDCLIEHNTVRDSDVGVEVSSRKEARPALVLLRSNEMERVRSPLVGDCVGVATIAP